MLCYGPFISVLLLLLFWFFCFQRRVGALKTFIVIIIIIICFCCCFCSLQCRFFKNFHCCCCVVVVSSPIGFQLSANFRQCVALSRNAFLSSFVFVCRFVVVLVVGGSIVWLGMSCAVNLASNIITLNWAPIRGFWRCNY